MALTLPLEGHTLRKTKVNKREFCAFAMTGPSPHILLSGDLVLVSKESAETGAEQT